MNTQFISRIIGVLNPKIANWRIETHTSNDAAYAFCAQVGHFKGLVMTMETNFNNHICLTFVDIDELRTKSKEEINEIANKRTIIIRETELIANLEIIGFGKAAPQDIALPVCAK